MTDRILLTAPASGCGKTMITCGMLRALQMQGKRPVSFKCGPDYIDPMFHSRVLGTKSRNLDTFFTSDETVRMLLAENCADADIAVLEGVMGYYDGTGGTSVRASAYDVARATGTPAVLIVNAKGASVSLIPMIEGFLRWRDSGICGVIFNRMSPMLYPRIKELTERELPVRAAGYVPELSEGFAGSRHLGLLMPDEITDLQEKIDHLAETLLGTLEWGVIYEIAAGAEVLEISGMQHKDTGVQCEETGAQKKITDERQDEPGAAAARGLNCREPFRVGIARDEAFCFFYEDNFRLLREFGAELVWFSPMHDESLPENLDGLLLYGGYPELYAKELSENCSMLESVRTAVGGGMPCMAECGGFLYLHEQMEGKRGQPESEYRSGKTESRDGQTEYRGGQMYPMAGVIDGQAKMTEQLQRFGYITLSGGTVFGRDVGPIPSHEFHYFDSDSCGDAFLAQKPESSRSWRCIHSTETLFAGFPHLYFYANPAVAGAFAGACRKFHIQKQALDS